MKTLFKPGDSKKFAREVTNRDFAEFNGQVLHKVYSTFSLARDFEWSSRLFFLEMKEEDEEGVGTFVHIDHRSPAFEGECVEFTAMVESIKKNELICSIEARVGDRLVAVARTGQKMLKKEKLQQLFTKPAI